jgi:hypothetical protein
VLAVLQPALLLRSRDHPVYPRIAGSSITPAAKATTCPLYHDPKIITLQGSVLERPCAGYPRRIEAPRDALRGGRRWPQSLCTSFAQIVGRGISLDVGLEADRG